MNSVLTYMHKSCETSRIARDWRRRMLWRIPKGCRRCKALRAESLRPKDRGKHKFYFYMFSNMSPELLNFQQFFCCSTRRKKENGCSIKNRSDREHVPVGLYSYNHAGRLRPVFQLQDQVRSGSLLRRRLAQGFRQLFASRRQA